MVYRRKEQSKRLTRAKRGSLTRTTGEWGGRKKASVSLQPRTSFSAFVKLFVRRVYLDMQKYELFCSLLVNLLSDKHSNSFHMQVFPSRILGFQPSDNSRRPRWWCVGGQYNRVCFRRIYMKIEFSSQRREMLFVLDHQHTAVTSRANQQLLM